ncbi:MAG: imelysin family protein [Marinagarivorans sp.]|nr:imelysin family protein [Marinagarivorans sp.]
MKLLKLIKIAKSSVLLACIAAGCLTLTACNDTRENDSVVVTQAVLDATLAEAVDAQIVPAVDRFKHQNQALINSANTFCATPSETHLIELQNQWKNLAAAWYALLPYNFGPLNDDVVFPEYIKVDSYRLNGTDYTATVRAEITKNLKGSFALNADYFAAQAFQKLGLLALEVALFESYQNAQQTPAVIVEEFVQMPRKCQVVQGLAQQLMVSANYFENGWRSDYKNTGKAYRTLFLNAQLADGTPPITQLLSSVQEALDYLKKRNVVNNRAQLSGETWVLMAALVDEVDTLLNGTGRNQFAIFSLMTANGYSSSVAAVKTNIAGLRDAINSRDAGVFASYLGLLDGNFKREIPNALNVQLGLNFTDGD